MWDNFKAWLAAPYSDDMTALDWFFFIGLLTVISILWRILLVHILETTE